MTTGEIVASDLLADFGEGLADVLGAAGLSGFDGFVDEDADVGRLEAVAIDQRGLEPDRHSTICSACWSRLTRQTR